MTALGNGLSAAKHFEASLTVREAELSILRRIDASEEELLIAQGNLASAYQSLGRLDDALRIERKIYTKRVVLRGNLHLETLVAAICLANTLSKMHRYDEVLRFAPARIAECQGALGAENENTLFFRTIYARALFTPATPENGEQAETILVDVIRIARRVLGPSHPRTRLAERSLETVRKHSTGNIRTD